MKRHSLPLTALSSVALCSSLITLQASAEEGANNENQEEVIVRGQYLQSNQVNALRTPTPILDVPQSLSIVTLEEIERQGFTSLGDIVNYTPGVNNTQGDCADNQLEGTVATTWKLSSSLGEGVLWHQLGETTFDPPVQIAEARMLEGDTVTSESDGVTYTSEYVDLIPCPAENYWPDPESRADCYHLQVTADGDADLVGNYYIAQRFTFAAFQQGGDSEPTWELLGFDEAE